MSLVKEREGGLWAPTDMLPVYCVGNFPACVLVDQGPWLRIFKTLERWEQFRGYWLGGKSVELEMTGLKVESGQVRGSSGLWTSSNFCSAEYLTSF